MTTTVNATTTTPTHHISLTDGVTTLGFILRQGNRIDPRAIERRPRQNGQYSPFTQSDWGSGRGIKDAQSDRSRYADGKRAITRHSGTVMLGGQETYTTIDCCRWSATGLKYFLNECGFPLEKISTKSWGNRECLDAICENGNVIVLYANQSLENEAKYPISVWGWAQK